MKRYVKNYVEKIDLSNKAEWAYWHKLSDFDFDIDEDGAFGIHGYDGLHTHDAADINRELETWADEYTGGDPARIISSEFRNPFITLMKWGMSFEMLELSGDTLGGYEPGVDGDITFSSEAISACVSDYADWLYDKWEDNPVVMLTKAEAEECGKQIAEHAQYTIDAMWTKEED